MSFGQVWQNASEKIWVHDKEKQLKTTFLKLRAAFENN